MIMWRAAHALPQSINGRRLGGRVPIITAVITAAGAIIAAAVAGAFTIWH